VVYAVCTECVFLRAYSTRAAGSKPPESCPACGGEMIIRESAGRFPPAYVGRLSLNLLAEPALAIGRRRNSR
jgi:hypothetical protein